MLRLTPAMPRLKSIGWPASWKASTRRCAAEDFVVCSRLSSVQGATGPADCPFPILLSEKPGYPEVTIPCTVEGHVLNKNSAWLIRNAGRIRKLESEDSNRQSAVLKRTTKESLQFFWSLRSRVDRYLNLTASLRKNLLGCLYQTSTISFADWRAQQPLRFVRSCLINCKWVFIIIKITVWFFEKKRTIFIMLEKDVWSLSFILILKCIRIFVV